ncbi:MAG: Spy/CpxP family protein refolding chaperone [Candidatus Aminicenantes bacterium]|nr:Spy/CpxP family protein refolding chaperone [Candidatus Aminicenantes bacterium]
MKRLMSMMVMAAFLAALVAPMTASAQGTQDKPAEKKPVQAGERLRMLGRDVLDLTPEQQKKLEEFRLARQNEDKAFREQMQKLRTEYRELMNDPKANEAKLGGLIDQMSKMQADRMKAGLKNRLAREKIFTPEQLEKMKEYRGAFMNRGRMGMMGRGPTGRLGMNRFHMRGLMGQRMGPLGPGFGPDRMMNLGPRLRQFLLQRRLGQMRRQLQGWRRG